MRKRKIIGSIICICFILLLSACGQATAQMRVEPSEEPVLEPSSEELLYEKYKEVISDLEEEDYDGAIAAIEEKRKEALKENAGDIEDYLVTVELTPENFNEYFEFVLDIGKNAFGEDTETFSAGLKSKKYDSNLIIYNMDDRNYNDDITVEFNWDIGQASDTSENKLTDLLGFRGFGMASFYKDTTVIEPTGRIAGQRITFIKKDYVESYEIEEVEPNMVSAKATITLKNGDSFERFVNPNYPY